MTPFSTTWPAGKLRAALEQQPDLGKDGWIDTLLELEGEGDDGPQLPRGCVPYLPTSVVTILRLIDAAQVHAGDTFVDIGSGVGRAITLVHLLTGATAIGIEIQPQLVRQARELAARLGTPRVSSLEGDADELVAQQATGSVFYLYAPFSGARLDRVLDALDVLARSRPIRICAHHLPLPERADWVPMSIESDLTVYSSARSS